MAFGVCRLLSHLCGAHERNGSKSTLWRLALVNQTGITDPTGAVANAPGPNYDDA